MELPRIPGYLVKKQVGRGGMAAVFLADQESIDREVALKVMLPELGADPSFGERFIREAKIVAKLTHPNIVAIYDVGKVGTFYYMSMELLPGGELKDRIGDAGLPIADALRITRQIAAALGYAHEHGYVHRDVKPENVLFRKDGTAVLSDFGIARAHDLAATRMTATGAVVGTPYYMSPEQAQGKELDGRSDLYSLGMMFFEMLTGIVPFRGDSALSIGIRHLRDPIPRLPGQYQKYQGLFDKMAAKNPEDRWQTGAEIVRAIETLEHGGNVVADPALASTQVFEAQPDMARTMAQTRIQMPASGSTTPPPPARGKGMGMAAVAGMVIVAVAGGYFYLQQDKRSAPATPGVAIAPSPETPHTSPAAATSPEEDERRLKIGNLLNQAKTAVAEKRLYGQDGNNATALFKSVLALDQNDRDANAGLLEISQHFVTQAEKAIEAGRLEEGEAHLKVADDVYAENPMIFNRRLVLKDAQERARRQQAQQAAAEQARQQQAKTAKDTQRQRSDDQQQARTLAMQQSQRAQQEAAAEKAREEQLASLLGRAREYLSPGGLTPARAALAYDLYREAMRQSPGDNRAQQGLLRVADAYFTIASARFESGQYDEAGGLVRKGLDIAPDHARLLGLQREIRDSRETASKAETPKPQRTFGGF